MEDDTRLENKNVSIGKAIGDLRGVVDAPLSLIKEGLEKSFLNLYRRGIAAFDHSVWKYRQGSKK